MKKLFSKVLAGLTATVLAFAAPVASLADSFQPGQNTNVLIQFFVQNGETEDGVNSWNWMDTADDTMVYRYGEAAHYVLEIDDPEQLFERAADPIARIGFQIGYWDAPASGTVELGVSVQNIKFNFDGYPTVEVPGFTSNEAKEQDKFGCRQFFQDYFPVGDDTLDDGEYIRKLVSVEYDAAVVYLNVFDADGNEIVVPAKEEIIEETTEEVVEETTTQEEETTTLEEETTVKEEPSSEEEVEDTTLAEVDDTTLADDEDDTTLAEDDTEEAVEKTTESAKENKDKSDGNTVKIIITIVFVIILLAALGVVGFMYMKRR